MEFQKYKDLIDAFLKWNDEHPLFENPYKDQLTYLNLSSLKKDAFIKFFYDFYADGGKIQSGAFCIA